MVRPCLPSEDQYGDDANLRARQSIYAFQQPQVDLPRAVVDLARPVRRDVALDVGCGNGAYLVELDRRGLGGTVLGLDLSVGMLRAAERVASGAYVVAADARAMPVRDRSVSLVIAAHMLYHVPDPAVAMSELRRVIRSGGRALVVLNADDHLCELRLAVQQARQELGLSETAFGERLRLAQGQAMLSKEFGSVVRHEFKSQLVLYSPELLAEPSGLADLAV
ncbi:MAG: class I SAM-dependent methyltransferase [Acidimicrobiales bacterium]